MVVGLGGEAIVLNARIKVGRGGVIVARALLRLGVEHITRSAPGNGQREHAPFFHRMRSKPGKIWTTSLKSDGYG
jgi:hypothetical protein